MTRSMFFSSDGSSRNSWRPAAASSKRLVDSNSRSALQRLGQLDALELDRLLGSQT